MHPAAPAGPAAVAPQDPPPPEPSERILAKGGSRPSSAAWRARPASMSPAPASDSIHAQDSDRRDVNSSGSRSGRTERINAPTPAASGEAKDVPARNSVPPPRRVVRMESPGAAKETHGPRFEKLASASLVLVAATAMAFSHAAG